MKIWHKRLSKSFRSTLLYTVTSFINQFGGLLVLPFIWNGLTIEDFAVIGVIEAATPFLASILTLSTEQYLTRYYYTWPELERTANVEKNFGLSLGSVIVVGALLMVTLLIIAFTGSISELDYYLYGLLHIIFFSFFAFPNALFRIANQTNQYVVFTMLMFASRLVMNYAGTISLGLGLEGYVISNTINSVIFFIGINVYLLTRYKVHFDRDFIHQALRFSIPYIPSNLLANVSTLADRLVLGFFGGRFEVGVLTLGQKVASITGSLSQAIKLGYVPYISEFVSREGHSVKVLNRSRMYFLAPISLISLLLIVFGVDLLALVGMDVRSVDPYMYLLVLIVYLNANNLFFSPGLYLSGRSGKMWIPNFLQVVVRVTLYFVFVPTLHLKGVIFASLIASFILFVHNYYLSEKYYHLGLSWIDILLQFLPFIATAGIASFGINVGDLNLFIRGGMLAFYLLLLWLFLLSDHEKRHTSTT